MSDIDDKVREMIGRIGQLEEKLANPAIIKDRKKYQSVYREYGRLTKIKKTFATVEDCRNEIKSIRELLKAESDDAMVEFLTAELTAQTEAHERNQSLLMNLLIPADKNDSCNTILELRAGTGGQESALFVGDCVRMYRNFAQSKKWRVEVLEQSQAEGGGFKTYCMVLAGDDVYKSLRYEAGTHRVQRIPTTESQGRIHTSAITISVYLEPQEDDINIDMADLKIDTYRASGAGGQHVNTTDSAVRITHLPTNTVVTCQDERSQHKNKAKALRIMQAKVLQKKREDERSSLNELRQEQIGSGDRSEKIRTYNFPQNRVTDHRIKFTSHKLHAVMEGAMDEIIDHLINYFSQAKLEAWLNSPN